MSRLDEEYIMAVVRNRSGIDSGEIDYSIKVDRFDKLSERDLNEVLNMLDRLEHRVIEEISRRQGELTP